MKAIIYCYRWVWIVSILAALAGVADLYGQYHLDNLTVKHAALLAEADSANASAENLSPAQIDVLLRPVDMRQWGAHLSVLAAEQQLKGFTYHLLPVKSEEPTMARYQLILSFDAPSDIYAYAFLSRLSSLAVGRLAFDVLDMDRPVAGAESGASPSALNVRTTLDWLTNPPQQLSQSQP